jgi:hypothetical protein
MKALQREMQESLHNVADITRQGGHEANQYNNFSDFMDTKPPIFMEAVEPLEAVEWINTME